MNLLFNGQIILLIFGLCRMLFSDPGLVSHNPSPSDAIPQSLVLEIDTHHQDIGLGDRLRCCPICKTYVKGFDHHCPAFGNCIGHKNYVLFMVLLFGFIWTEATYITCLSQYSAESELLDGDGARSISQGKWPGAPCYSPFYNYYGRWRSSRGMYIVSASILERTNG
ncbi:palmitoyltransferase akr1-like isoform X5 [Cucumis melo var. makuwa]|uniref:S-acyltransferase n=1 Tax=Cucumis melo var. makuwa TaxID=1194695 RepID=A0A5D3DK81_CUCMM|nr:palmitoyltransferase akr1-like isoform X5 [Cucumis melo var. makuwa]TYK24007.1 palmitoyltransferase akr1-like isoform X5 [Cucumis melo var. makuwa]